MKAISIHQPWANYVVLGIKQYETRSWPTKIRGRVAIHAAKIKNSEYEEGMALGAIIGTVEITDCCPVEILRNSLSKDEIKRGDFSDGRYAWKLKHPVCFEKPILLRGYQGFWNLDDNLVKQIEKQSRAC
ncbi:ASCH domain-containing protein [Eubacterium callanderi]|uniref:ASCH domain protein n=2 Tax=Eubacterium TaxID=1730 RepID=A0A6N3HHZ5_EUBLI|nr:ASCH domain-containing protein [Eubacterium callanderi]MBO1700874.1 ASCH domain-containing protein [Eubacterium callanderi]MDR4075565.1 ASCH domain-containing protein [Eubacterium sp.]